MSRDIFNNYSIGPNYYIIADMNVPNYLCSCFYLNVVPYIRTMNFVAIANRYLLVYIAIIPDMTTCYYRRKTMFNKQSSTNISTMYV